MVEPPLPSEWLSTQAMAMPANNPGLFDVFLATLTRSLQAGGPLEDDRSSGCWLAALFDMHAASGAESMENIAHTIELHECISRMDDHLGTVRSSARYDKAQTTCADLKELQWSLADSIDQLGHFQKHCLDIRHSDYEMTLFNKQHLQQHAQIVLRNFRARIEDDIRSHNIRASETTIKESRSAVAGRNATYP